MSDQLNRSVVLENFMDEEELLVESIGLFISSAQERMAKLKNAINEKDSSVFMPEAHTIKGMIGIFSTGSTFKAAEKIEQKGRNNLTDGIDSDFAELENKMEEFIEQLKTWLPAG